MGLKTTNYEIKELGVTIPEAYAQIVSLTTNINGVTDAVFEIQQNRESIQKKKALKTVRYSVVVDKSLPIHAQVYEASKLSVFDGWEDDIVTESEVAEETEKTEVTEDGEETETE